MISRLRKIVTGASAFELVAAALLAFTVGLLVWWLLTEPGRARRETAIARGEQEVAERQVEAAAGASEITSGALGKTLDQAETTRRNNDAIRKAEGASSTVGAGVDRAGRCAIVMRQSYADNPRYAELRAACAAEAARARQAS